MPESLGNLMRSAREKMVKPLYNSGAVRVVRFEDSSKRPRSEEFQQTHPELYSFLLTGKPAGKFKVGILHLDGNGFISKERAYAGATPVSTAFRLKDVLRSKLAEIAQEMKDNPTSELGKLEYLTGFSLLLRARRAAESLGFEIFEMDADEPMKFRSASHRRIVQTYRRSNELGTTKRDLNTIQEKSAKVGLISREAILRLLPNTG